MRWTRGVFIGAQTTAFICLVGVCSLVAQSAKPQAAAPQASKPSEDTVLLAQGWARLAAGDPAGAAQRADAVLAKQPQSVAAVSLRVEAEIVRAGSTAGLTAYESWLGGRRLEDGYVLRRVARAALWELAARPESAVDALQQLAADGDAEARAQLVRRMHAGGPGETRALARIGDEGAIRRLISQVQSGSKTGSKMVQIDALIESGSPLAVEPLMKFLSDIEPTHVANAADGLGSLNAKQAIPQLQRLYQSQEVLPSVRYAAASGLFRMGDSTGIQLLQEKLASEFPYVAVDTARRMASQPDGTWHVVVRKAISDSDPGVRVIAADLMAPFERDLSREVLEQLMADPNPAIRQKASRTFVARLAGDFASLRRFLRSDDAATRTATSGRILELSR